MSDKRSEIIEASMRVFMRYGLRRTTMGDIATEAKVSRPTLYGQFKNKDEVINAAILYQNASIVQKIEAAWADVDKTSDKIDIYFQHAVVYFYDLFQRWPDASDLIEVSAPSTHDTMAKCYQNFDRLLEQLLNPFQADVAQSPADLAVFIRKTTASYKTSASSRDELDKMLQTLRHMILSILPNAD